MEYLSKKAVLDAFKDKLTWASYEEKLAFEYVIDQLQSGAFDADGEIQRLRAAAIKLHETLNTYWQGDCEKVDVVAAQSKLCDALSTTTEPCVCESIKCECGHHEPTAAERVREIECPCCGCEIRIEPEGDGYE